MAPIVEGIFLRYAWLCLRAVSAGFLICWERGPTLLMRHIMLMDQRDVGEKAERYFFKHFHNLLY